jgi:hypothetical protein
VPRRIDLPSVEAADLTEGAQQGARTPSETLRSYPGLGRRYLNAWARNGWCLRREPLMVSLIHRDREWIHFQPFALETLASTGQNGSQRRPGWRRPSAASAKVCPSRSGEWGRLPRPQGSGRARRASRRSEPWLTRHRRVEPALSSCACTASDRPGGSAGTDFDRVQPDVMGPFGQAVLVLRWFRECGCVHCLARDAEVSSATTTSTESGSDQRSDNLTAPQLVPLQVKQRTQGLGSPVRETATSREALAGEHSANRRCEQTAAHPPLSGLIRRTFPRASARSVAIARGY